jgi:hypothetical protein
MSKNIVKPQHQGGRTLAKLGRKANANNPPKKQRRAIWSGGSAKGSRFPYDAGGIAHIKANVGFTETERERNERLEQEALAAAGEVA